MVQILRDKTRNYIADQTGSIRTSQIAQNVSEWNQVIQGAGKIVGSVMANEERNAQIEQAKQEKAEQEWYKQAQTADETFINTQVGQQANIKANEIVNQEIATGKLNPNTEQGKSRINAIFAKSYSDFTSDRPLQTEAGITKLEEMQRKGADKAIISGLKAYGKATSETAQKLTEIATKDFGQQAYEQGTRQDYQDIDGKADYVKYLAKKTGANADEIEAQIDKQIGQGRLLGVADTDVITAASALDNKEILHDHFMDVVNADPSTAKLSDEKKEKLVQNMINDKARKEISDEDLRSIVGDKYFNAVATKNKEVLQRQKEDLQRQIVSVKRELSLTNKKSENGKKFQAKLESLQKNLESLQEKIDSDDETADYESIRAELNATLDPIIKKRYAELKQQKKADYYNTSLNTWVNGMSPDLTQATQARWDIFASENLGVEKNQTKIGEWEEQNQSPIPQQMSLLEPFKDEIDTAELASAYQEYVNNSSKVRPDLHDTYIGTMAMHDSLQELLNGNYETPIQAVVAGYNTLNKMWNTAGLTQDQQDKFSTLVYKAVSDKGFGDLMKDVFNSADRYYPDTSWMSNAFAPMTPNMDTKDYLGIDTRADYKKVLGVPAGGIARTDKTNVQRMMDTEIKNTINAAFDSMIEASYLPEEQRQQVFQQIGNALVENKERIYNKAMAEYGIDLNYLDEVLKTKGQAFTQIGFQLKEYKGRLDNGTPIFADIEQVSAGDIQAEKDYWLDVLKVGQNKDLSKK